MKASNPVSRGLSGAFCATLCVLVLLLPLFSSQTKADGMFVAPRGWFIWEYEQVALLEWDEEATVETLTLLPGFRGETREFAWVVPVPAVPEFATASRWLFNDLFAMTTPEFRGRNNTWSCNGDQIYADDAPGATGLEVIQHDLVGIYDVMVLAADDATALNDTLTAWGYLHDGNSGQVLPLLSDYVDRGWVFVTMKVDSTAFADAYPGYDEAGGYVYGGMQPIELTFNADAPIYPMRLSSASAAWRTQVAVFVCAEHRMDFPGATAAYANRFSVDELDALGRLYPTIAGRLRPGCFLTRLNRSMSPAEMDRDLELTPAASDAEFREIRYSRFPVFGVFVGAWTVVWSAWKLRRRSRTVLGRHLWRG